MKFFCFVLCFLIEERSASIKENYWLYAVKMTRGEKDATVAGMT